jgi:L-iditol 2-dehydrogenase
VSGNTQLCPDSLAIGVDIDGAFAEFVRIPEAAVRQGNVVEIPEGLSFEAAAMAEPLSCVYNAYQKIGIYPGDTVLVIGSGPIGIMHAKVALMAGAARVYVNDISEERLSLVKKIVPAAETILTDSLHDAVMELTGGKGVNLVITAASVPSIQESAFSMVGMNGRVMFFGGLPKGKSVVQLDTNEIHYKQITVSGTTRQSLEQYRKVIALLAAGKLTVDDLVTSVSSISDIGRVISDVASGRGLKSNIRI